MISRMAKSHRRAVVISVSAAVVLLGAGATVLVVRHRPPPPPPAAAPSVKTAVVEKSDLANTRSVPATLGFGPPRAVKGAGTGAVTKLPVVGDVAAAGVPLYRVNDVPVPVFFGATPLFRKLDTPGTKGSDVAVVMDNLARLGYAVGRRPDDDAQAEFTPKVVEALRTWQGKAGLERTGSLDVGQVFVLEAPIRVASVTAQPGAAPTEELFTATPTTRVVTMSVAVGEAGALTAGAPVLVVRPDAREVPAKVGSVGTAATTSESGNGPAKLAVVITPDDPADVADLDSAPVQVKITTESRTGVLVVPVEALVALREGGYAVQRPDGGLLAVETGLYSRDRVEVSGAGVTAGLTVVTAR
jgi:peptidoglycan hydrolase-like protein with peptidoglycan-binding domain